MAKTTLALAPFGPLKITDWDCHANHHNKMNKDVSLFS